MEFLGDENLHQFFSTVAFFCKTGIFFVVDEFLLLMVFCNQANHRFTTTIQRRLYGQATDVKIRPLNEEKAVQAAADLIGELFVFSVVPILRHSFSDITYRYIHIMDISACRYIHIIMYIHPLVLTNKSLLVFPLFFVISTTYEPHCYTRLPELL